MKTLKHKNIRLLVIAIFCICLFVFVLILVHLSNQVEEDPCNCIIDPQQIRNPSIVAAPKLIWKKKFKSRIFKTSTIISYKIEKDAVFPLKSLITEQNAFLFDTKGNIEKNISLKTYNKATMSDNGSTIAAIRDGKISVLTFDKQHHTFKLQDHEQMLLPQHINLSLSPDGKYIVIISLVAHSIYFYSNTGTILSKNQFQDLKGATIKFSTNSAYAGIHIPNYGKGNTSGYLLFFNRKGNSLWKFSHKGCQANFDVSCNGENIVLIAEGRLFSLNDEGDVLYEKQFSSGKMEIGISQNGQYLSFSKKREPKIFYVDNLNGKILWSKQISNVIGDSSLLTSLLLSTYGDFIVLSARKDWRSFNNKSYLLAYNKLGIMIWQLDFLENQVKPDMSMDQNCMIVKGNYECFLYIFTK